MPKSLERKLKLEARKKGLRGEAVGRYVYGTMNKLGFMKGSKVVAHPKQHKKGMR